MKRTEKGRLAAQVFYADFLLPLKRANMRRNFRYLDLDWRQESYWDTNIGGEPAISAVAQGSATSLLRQLAAYWETEHDGDLARLVPFLIALREEIAACPSDEAQDDASPPDFVYPLF